MVTSIRQMSAALGFVFMTVTPATAAELVMFDSPVCEYCEQWDEEIAAIYPKTDEGRAAPLRRLSIHDPLPEDLSKIKAIVYTPTFVLIENGRELGRISGYPGEDFFWGFLENLIAKLPNPPGDCLATAHLNLSQKERIQGC